MDTELEPRKQAERDYANSYRRERETDALRSNHRWYSITRRSQAFHERWMREHCASGVVLDYGCGWGDDAVRMAQAGSAHVIGIDISDVSVEQARKQAEELGLAERCEFRVEDAEHLPFPDSYFDAIHINGVLHHLDVHHAYPELARILKPGGSILAREALGHNPLIQMYRDRTPALRTEWEARHIIKRPALVLAERYFGTVDYRFWHLASIPIAFLRNTPMFAPALRLGELADDLLFAMPGIRWWAWMISVEFKNPKKSA